MGMGGLALADSRNAPRDEVHYRARAAGLDGKPLSLLIVNMSALGLMARCDTEYAVGEKLRVTLPVIGSIMAEIRWSLGGRIGCELDRPIELADYYEVLAALIKGS